MALRVIAMAVAVAGGVMAVARGEAQVTASEAVLIRSLDQAFTPGLLSTSGVRKNADGTYARDVTTGDAIARPTFGKPLQIARAACSEAGGVLALALSAGRYAGPPPRAVVWLGDERLEVDYDALFDLFAGVKSTVFDAGSAGFKPMFATSVFAARAAAQADAAPPFGLFICTASGGTQYWGVAIMPDGMPAGYDLPVRVTPVTESWIRARRLQAASVAQAADRAQVAAARRQREDADHARAEALRLRPFRAGLKIGSRTNCGVVIAVRGPLVEVQLPPNVTGPSGIRDFWAPRDEMTDAPPPQGCRFGAY